MHNSLFIPTCFLWMILLTPLWGFAQENGENSKIASRPKNKFITKKLTSNPPVIDGVLDDPAWDQIAWSSSFLQREPEEGKQPKFQTQFKILYDDRYLYFGVLSLDSEPDKIVKRLSRRDGYEGDWVEVSIDSYHDLRTAFSFNLTAAGVKGEKMISNDGQNIDKSWNPIWFAKAGLNEQGWVAELKIPLSQLRFGNDKEQIWGLQVIRRLFRKEEISSWQLIPREGNGWVSQFGELHGLKDLVPQKQKEIQPFVLASLDTYEKEEGNPFRDGTDYNFNVGVDGKWTISNDLSIDFTLNPDFGQVEADPSRIALDGFQVFFEERRPFFVENKNIFTYQVSSSKAGNTLDSDNLFYSRRIGRRPYSTPDLKDNEHADIPNNTSILAAVKFSGKTKNGWSIGLLESITANEYAIIRDNENRQRKEIVEPLTNYFVGRLQKDFNNRNSYIGGIFTASNRDLPDHLTGLHQSAYSGGIDFKHHWNNRSWYLGGDVIFSRVNGSYEAITATQKSNEHNFDRVDASHLNLDTEARSLFGTGGNIQVGRIGKGLIFESGLTWRSPKLELNDLGFQRLADDWRHYTWAAYRITKPFSIFRNIQFNYKHWVAWDFGGQLKSIEWNLNTDFTLKNNWQGGIHFNYRPVLYSNTALRGGPRLRLNPELSQWIWFYSDQRNKLRMFGYIQYDFAKEKSKSYLGSELTLVYQPSNAIKTSISLGMHNSKDQLQYVKNLSFGTHTRYVNAFLNQQTLSFSFRLNYIINPDLSIQYWGQPYVSQGRYSQFKYISRPKATNFSDRFNQYSSQQMRYYPNEDRYLIDENTDKEIDYSFSNPDFSFLQFRSNLVLRWEYIPGSEMYFVWSQAATENGDPLHSLGSNLYSKLFSKKLQNTFLIKLTYRLVM